MYKIGAILAINPPYNFKQSKIKNPSFAKIYGGVMFVVMSLVGAYVFILNQSLIVRKYYTLPHCVLDTLNDMLLFTSAVLIIVVNCTKHNQWIIMNNNFQCIDYKLKNRNKCVRVFKNANFKLVILTLFFLCFDGYLTIIVYQTFPEIIYTIYFWLHQIFYVFEYYITILGLNLVISLKVRYEDLNKLLNLKSTEPTSKIVGANYFQHIAQLSRKLFENVGIFNEIFGWSMLLIIGRSVLQLLLSLDSMVVGLKNNFYNINITISNCLLVGYMVVSKK